MIFNVKDFGAVPNSEKVQTKNFQAALDACFHSGGGEVIIPAGKYVVGAIRIRGNTVFHLMENASLIASKNLGDYGLLNREDGVEPLGKEFLLTVRKREGAKERVRRWHNALIHIYKAKNVSLIGEEGSVIDGGNLYDENGEEGYRGPHCISVLESENVYLSGYTVINSANWAHCMWLCRNLTAENLKIYGGHDGIDFFGSDNVTVSGCVLQTGDDCIAGFDNQYVRIENCELNSSCSALRFAGTHVAIKNCRAYGPGKFIHRNSLSKKEKMLGLNASPEKEGCYRNNMLSFITYYADYRLKVRRPPSDIVVSDCTVSDCDRFLHFNFSGNEQWQSETPLKDVTFKNIVANNVKLPINLYGDRDNPVSLVMENCKIDFSEENKKSPLILAANYEKITLKNVFCNNEYLAAIDCFGDAAGEISITGGSLLDNFEKEIQFKKDYKVSSI